MPLNLNCQPNNVVVAMKLPYIDSQAPKELEKVVLMNYNDTKKVHFPYMLIRDKMLVSFTKQLLKLLHCIALHCIVLHFIVLYCIVLYCILLYCIVLYCIVLDCIGLYCIVLYCIVLYCIVLYCIVLYCIVL